MQQKQISKVPPQGTRRSLDQTSNPGARHPCLAVGYQTVPDYPSQPPTRKTWTPGGRGFCLFLARLNTSSSARFNTPTPKNPSFLFQSGGTQRPQGRETRWRKLLKKLGPPSFLRGSRAPLGDCLPGARLPPHYPIASLFLWCGGGQGAAPVAFLPSTLLRRGLGSPAGRGGVRPRRTGLLPGTGRTNWATFPHVPLRAPRMPVKRFFGFGDTFVGTTPMLSLPPQALEQPCGVVSPLAVGGRMLLLKRRTGSWGFSCGTSGLRVPPCPLDSPLRSLQIGLGSRPSPTGGTSRHPPSGGFRLCYHCATAGLDPPILQAIRRSARGQGYPLLSRLAGREAGD